ncbi:MAG: phage tail protein I [Aeromonas sobria]
MATIYPIWRGSLTYHDGTLSFDGAAIYRGTQQGEDDPAPDAIAGVSVGLTVAGIEEGKAGLASLTQRAKPTGINQFAAGANKLTSRAKALAISDGAQGDPATTTQATVATMGDLLAMGAADMSIQITLAGLDAGIIGTAGIRTRLGTGGLQPDAIEAPTIQQLLAPAGFDLGALGSHKAKVRQTIGDLSDGQQGDPRLMTKLAQAATAFTGAMGTPIAKYAQIIYPMAPALPAATLPALTITVAHSALVAPQLSPITTTARLGTRGIDTGAFGSTKVHRLPLPLPVTRDLLPPSVTRLEHVAAATLASNLTPELITSTRFADTCPAPLLPWLAWARSVDWWELAESEDQQRALIKASYRLHQRKGTPWAIKEALNVLGFGDSTIIERATGRRYDGTLSYNGNEPHGDPTRWAVYRVILTRPVTTEQANRIKRLLAEMAPARCHLSALDYTSAPVTYNGAATYNGNYNHGAS